MAEYLAADPTAYVNFRRFAIHVWKRHLSALEEEVRKRRQGGPGNDGDDAQR